MWRRCRDQLTYRFSAIAATALFVGLAAFATYYRFFYHTGDYATFPWAEFWATIAMIGGGVVRPCTLVVACTPPSGSRCRVADAASGRRAVGPGGITDASVHVLLTSLRCLAW